MDTKLKVLIVNVSNSFYKILRFNIGDFFGPVDLGLHLSARYDSLNIGTGLLCGSIFPGSNRLIFTGFSPCWGGFYISSMGGAGLIFDNLGINMLSITGKTQYPSILYLNRNHGEEIEVEIIPIDYREIWKSGRQGTYAIMDYCLEKFGHRYNREPRILAVGPASEKTDFGGIISAPIKDNKVSFVDTWAGRGGFGSKLFQDHGIVGIIYGGTYVDEDFRDRKVADEWFENKYHKRMAAKDLEATTKYRFDHKFDTGGTFGVNFASVGGRLLAFNYKTIYLTEEERLKIHKNYIIDHYLKQFNEETIKTKQNKTCGEPCVAVCKKMYNEFKKDYEPYQTLGPLCGIFDQRSAEKLTHHADMLGFDAISVGGVLSWLMECIDENILTPDELGINLKPTFSLNSFDIIKDSQKNAEVGIALLDSIIGEKSLLTLRNGVREWARNISVQKKFNILNLFVFNSFGRNGWMVPNQYWTAGVLSPMPIMGKYYMDYSNQFIPPFVLGQINAERMRQELLMDNMGFCRFHRGWAEEMIPEIIEALYSKKHEYIASINKLAAHINTRNASIFWESERNYDFIYYFLKRKKEVEHVEDKELDVWLERFDKDCKTAALDFWYDIHKGAHISLRNF